MKKSERKHILTGLASLDGLLGGGIVEGSSILIVGDRGIGKSELAAQVALACSREVAVLYADVDGNEQVRSLLGGAVVSESGDVNCIVEATKDASARVLVVDSIHTTYVEDVKGDPGSIEQMKAVANYLTSFAQQEHVATLAIVHGKIESGNIQYPGQEFIERLFDVVVDVSFIAANPDRDLRQIAISRNKWGSVGAIYLKKPAHAYEEIPLERATQKQPEQRSSRANRGSRNTCPGCTEPVERPEIEDARGRAWHQRCALERLGRDYRTPLSPEEATARVEFACQAKNGSAIIFMPHAARVREIVFPDEGAEFHDVLVGNQRVVGTDGSTTLRARDIGGRAVIDAEVPKGLAVTLQAPDGTRFVLVCERVPEKGSRLAIHGPALWATHLGSPTDNPIRAKETSRHTLFTQARFRGEILAVDDWRDWEVSTEVVGSPNTRHVVGTLSGPVTKISPPITEVTEQFAVDSTNLTKRPRRFEGRLYGQYLFAK